MLGELVVLLAWPTREADENGFLEIQVAARKEDVSFYDHNGTIPSAGYSQNDTSPKSLRIHYSKLLCWDLYQLD